MRIGGVALDRRTGARLRARIGFLTEAPGLRDQLTVLDNVAVYARLFGTHDARSAVEDVLRRFELWSAIDFLRIVNEHSFMASTAARRAPALAERADKADKRDAILRAAIETFAARGFFNAQVADVARGAGVAAGTVYLYFRGKDDLLISIFERTMKEAIAAGRDSVAAGTSPLEQLRAIAALHLERLGRDRDLAVVFQIELRQSTKFMERFSATYLREYLGIIRDVIAEGQTKGVFRKQINPTLAAKMLFGALDEMATNWILSRRKYSLAAEADGVVDLFVGGLGT